MAGSSPGRPASTDGIWTGPATVFHGEGAFWDSAACTFRYVDMLSGDVISNPGGSQVRTHLGDVVALIRRRESGGYVIADEHGFVLLDDHLIETQSIPVITDPSLRMNEGSCDQAGRLFCGSMAYDTRPGAGTLYRLDPDLSVHVVLENVTIPNGLVWPSGNTHALHADTADRAVYAYDYDAEHGVLGDRQVFLDFPADGGAPDGMALDAEGGLWIAMWGGGEVRRYDPAGTLTDVIPLPVTNVTSCAFGGEAGSTLLITTSRQGIAAGSEPFAGRSYEIEVGVRGAEVHAFGG